MADFCFQCSVGHGFGPGSDFDHLGDPGEGMYYWVLCEGCGAIPVDARGWCVSPYCPVHGHTSPARWKVYESVWRAQRRRSGPLGWVYRLYDRFFGSPWDMGLIHYPGSWLWYVNQLYRGGPRRRADAASD
jgi:hypothetical protein